MDADLVMVVRGDREKPAGRDIVVGIGDERDEEAVRCALPEAVLHHAGCPVAVVRVR